MSYSGTGSFTSEKKAKKIVKKRWTEEEDRNLKAAVEKEGTKSWSEIAKYVENRSPKQCRERWLSNLSPENSKDEWSIEDDVKLIKLFSKYGSMWKSFTTYFKGRNDIALKNRYNWLKRKSIPDYLEFQEKNSQIIDIPQALEETPGLDFNAFTEVF